MGAVGESNAEHGGSERVVRGATSSKYELLPAFLRTRGLVKQHIDSFNWLVESELQKIVNAKNNKLIKCDADPSFFIRYLDIRVHVPSVPEEHSGNRLTTPQECRLRDLTYAAPIYVDLEFPRSGVMEVKRDVQIGRMPIMLRSEKCVLAHKNETEKMRCGECPLDPGGYFVVKGAEKVLLIQEQLSKNRILIDRETSGTPMASVTSSTHDRKSKTNVVTRKDCLYLKHNTFADEIPAVIALRAMGVESDQEAVQLIGPEASVESMLAPSVRECARQGVYTQHEALEYIGSRVRSAASARAAAFGGNRGMKKSKDEEARDVLAMVVLAHVPVPNYDFTQKRAYLAVMMRRLLAAMADPSHVDDRDYYGNKRLELAGGLLALLFEDLFKRMNSDLKRQAEAALSKQTKSNSSSLDPTRWIRQDTLTHGLEHAISTGNWTVKRFRMERKGVTQVLSRLSFVSALGMMTRITSQFEKTRKVSGPRALQPSQYGMLCPSDTPEGESCGLVKNLALLTHVTTDADEEPLRRAAFSLGVEPLSMCVGESLHSPHTTRVFLNGLLIGLHRHPTTFAKRLRVLRRRGRLGEFVSVHQTDDFVSISGDGGRVCRPLVVCNEGVPLVKDHHLQELRDGKRVFSDFLKDGLVEYLDVNEESNTRIALYEDGLTPEHTHLEIEPFTILGVCAGLIPYPHHNQSPRNTYQCAMGKQAQGAVGYNQLSRMDTLLYLLNSPQKPLVKTKTLDLINFDRLGGGQNAIVAVMCYAGYDIEDALIFNKASIDRGFGRVTVLRKQSAQLKRYPNRTADRLVPPNWSKAGKGNPQRLEADGICSVGAPLANGDVYVNKQTPCNTSDPVKHVEVPDSDYKPAPSIFKGDNETSSYVDQVLLTNGEEGQRVIKTLLRNTRKPEVGDKFSSRHGQKGVIGHIAEHEDLPFTDSGVVPDIIMNPHGFPSRMTVGKMLELVGAKASVFSGHFHYGTAFGGDSVQSVSSELEQAGYSFSGKEYLTSGITGEPMKAYLFIGPVYYQKLKHMVLDKMHARARGPRVVLTRQPTEGRSRDGGLRLGEMERDCLISYGAGSLIRERLMGSSDEFTVNVCATCGHIGYFHQSLKAAFCTVCDSAENMNKLQIPYACKLLFQELNSVNIVPRISLKNK